MVHDIVRRNFLKGVGAAGVAGLAGLSGCIGDDGGGDGPEGSVVINCPESDIQLFRGYYSAFDGSEGILTPSGICSGSIPGQVDNDTANVTGTAPIADGPNQDTFSQLSEDEYDTAPDVFTPQTYDLVAIQLLSNATAGENSDPAIKDQVRQMADPDGMIVGPDSLVKDIETATSGEDIGYQGVSSSVNFDENGDPMGAAYSIWEFDAEDNAASSVETQSFAGENPDGDGPSVDSGPGGSNRKMSAGILLPETDDLAAVGAPIT